jgi:hypothetical protein
MRQFVAVAFLGATLAFSASAALAYGDKIDYVPSYQQPAQSVSIVSQTVIRTGSSESLVAGGRNTTATDVYRQLREDNREH